MKPTKLIGHAGSLLDLLSLTLPKKDRIKILFVGEPGRGKTSLADQLAFQLCGGQWGIESVNGRHVSIHMVREWYTDFASSSLFGTGHKIKIINEVDTMPKDSQDSLLSFLDEMPPKRGFIGTSNLALTSLTERFRTRLQRYEVASPSADEIEAFITAEYALPPAIARQIATLCGGNVRAACLDAEAWQPEPEKARAPVVLQTSLAALGL